MIWIGTSGWVYPHWIERFYPPDLPMQDWLAYYARYFPTVEINRSFYRLPTYDQFRAWAEQTSSHPGFLFAVKASRYITHMKKLKDPQQGISRLMAAASGLGKQLGPFLYQLPPHWHANLERLELLNSANCALVVAVGGSLTTPQDIPAIGPFRYLRFHHGKYGTGFTDDELAYWAKRIRADAAEGHTIYAYFNNDPDGHAVKDALRLREMLGDAAVMPS